MSDCRLARRIRVLSAMSHAYLALRLIYRVPKLMLISRVQALLHDGRLKIHKRLPDAPALVAELQDFRAKVTDSGYWKFGARSGKHDDLVLAVAIALWRAHGDNIPGYGVFEYYRRLAAAQNVPVPQPEILPPPGLRLRVHGYAAA